MSRLSLVLAIHSHQPVGNFGHVFAEAYDRCYRPFLDVVAEHPHVKLALHHTGPLLEWIEAERPAYLKDVRALADRGQVEILGGGFYEPMLAVLPDRDAQGQIERMRAFCDRHFGQKPQGMWLAERVWDPDLPRVIHPTGTRFTLLDDSHFFAAGLPERRLYGHYVTEKAGVPLAVFPIDKGLRYSIPFKPVPELQGELVRMAREVPEGMPTGVLTYGDDGEKFGLWPGTHEWVYGRGWLRDFFRMLDDQRDLVSTVHPSRALEEPFAGRIYLPTASYEEMGEWSMLPDSIRRYEELKHHLQREGVYERYHAFVRGGIWQEFLAKYPESNHLHKRMLDVSRRVAEAEAKGVDTAVAKTELYRSQCNCAYWHGLFGGLYLNYLRQGVSSAILKAQDALDRAERGDAARLEAELIDFDADMEDEVLVRNRQLFAAIDPAEGGSLVELSYVPKAYAVTDVLSRRDEAYHDKLRELDRAAGQPGHGAGGPASIHDLARAKEQGLSRFLVSDGYRRTSFLDRFHLPGGSLDQLHAGGDGDVGAFARSRHRLLGLDGGRDPAEVTARLACDGILRLPDGEALLRLEKSYVFRREEGRVDVRYRLANLGDRPIEAIFAPELNLTLLAGDSPERFYELPDGKRLRLNHRGELPAAEKVRLCEAWAGFKIEVSSTRRFTPWVYPVETVSQSEGGFERTYQGSCLLLRMPLTLPPRGDAALSCSVALVAHAFGPDERA
ncbi:MAG TPA: alpha-amylase/4-alpha-glucanotransferase domain-containing protein [Myxococcales bacterium]|nr:alpha-amylase/4-alpha-glucanotransferase domain-containing protein [Myxococcales bacterium]